MNKIPTITHIITGLGKGGAERFLYNLLNSKLQEKFNNKVISLMSEEYYGDLIKKKNIHLDCINLNRGQINLSSLIKLYQILKKQKPDIVQGWMYHGNLAALLGFFMLKKKTKLVWNIRLSLEIFKEMRFKTRIMIKLGAFFSKIPDNIIYNSKRSLQQHRNIGFSSENDLFIPNGFNIEMWKPNKIMRQKVRNELKISKSTKVIGYIGRAEKQKDLPNLFEAFNIVKDKYSDVILVTIGKNLEKFASNHEKIIFLGEQSNVHEIMPSFDVFCLSSRAEGFPNVIGEAMLSGLPCVTTDSGDSGDIVGNTGWVVPIQNPSLLADSLIEALRSPLDDIEKYGKIAREKIVKNFDINYIKKKYISLYLSILEK